MAFHNDPPIRQITWPADATTGTTRIVAGADTPAELQTYGVIVAILFYIVDTPTNAEIGYFFIGISNTLDTGTDNVMLFGQVIYPIAGVPSSATAANVKTNQKITMNDAGTGVTKFSDFPVQLFTRLEFQSGGFVSTNTTFRNNPDNGRRIIVQPFNSSFALRSLQPTANGNSVNSDASIEATTIVAGAQDTPALRFFSPAYAAKVQAILRLYGQSSTSAVDDSFIFGTAASFFMSVVNATFTGNLNVNTDLFVTGNGDIDGTLRLGPGNQEIGQGVIAGSHSVTASAAVGATETVVSTANSATFYAGHTYKVTVYGETNVSAAALGNNPLFRLRKTNTAGQNLFNRRFYCPVITSGFPADHVGLFDVSGSNVTATLVLTLTGSAGFNAQHLAGGSNGRGFIVQDIGSAANPALDNANVVTLV